VIRRVSAVTGAVGVVLAVWWAGHSAASRALALIAEVHAFGDAAPLVFIALYAAAIVAFVPATLLTAAGGALFGLANGVLYALVGGTIGSTCAFLLGRHGARRIVERRLAEAPQFAAIDRAVSAKGRRLVFLLRLSPVAPFNFLNYALGLTTISVWDFMLAGAGSIPGEIVASYAGVLGGEALALASAAEAPKNASYYAVLFVGLVATIGATVIVARAARQALRDV
jgi:uncharacterized membrane protein YdjX (TVP38/TMEM64 family)